MLRALLMTAVVGAVPFAVMPPALADDADFLARLERFGIANENGSDALLDVGRQICVDLFNGTSGEDLAAEMFYNSAYGQEGEPRWGLSLTQARTYVVYAIMELCPGAKSIPGAIPE